MLMYPMCTCTQTPPRPMHPKAPFYAHQAPPAVRLVVAEVISVAEHPKAEKLKICEVDTGKATYKVCGGGGGRGGQVSVGVKEKGLEGSVT